jgi:hypothetical protein
LAQGVKPRAYIDVDPAKQGTHRDGRVVLSPDRIPTPEKAFVLGCVAKRGARALIRDHLLSRGFREGADFLFAA